MNIAVFAVRRSGCVLITLLDIGLGPTASSGWPARLQWDPLLVV